MADNRPKTILEILRKTFTLPKWITSSEDPFRTLIVTIISQNTADRNTARAFENLSNRFEITPEALSKAKEKEIEECLRVAGLYKNKTKTIKHVSKTILERYHGDMKSILLLPTEEARQTLMQFPGVGPKTADVVLLFSAKQNTIPVDTHVNRVSKRLGLAPTKGNYEAVRKSLQSIYDPGDYMQIHVLLIAHGRKYCKARVPLCKECPINMLCPSRHLWDRNE
ncbi:MAG TPA: endonuclease III [candidate division Zixibacteria bacterium]|nr:endonuclease III [candidate division Zixibacteria bacterium]